MKRTTKRSMVFLALSMLLRPWTSAAGADTANVHAPDTEQVLVVLPNATLDLSPSETSGRIEVALDGGAVTPVPGYVNAPASTGDHWLAVLFRDASGNTSPLEWIRLRVDGVAPNLEWAIEPKPYVDSAGRAWLPVAAVANVVARDDVAGVGQIEIVSKAQQVRVDDVNEASLELTATASGPQPVTLSASDRLGNLAREDIELFVDADAPRGELVVEGNQLHGDNEVIVNRDAKVVLTIEDRESGLKSWTPITNQAVVEEDSWAGPWSEGVHVLSAEVEDFVGNRATIRPLKLVVDDQPPTVQWRVESALSANRDGISYYRSPVTLTAESTDDRAGVDNVQWSEDGTSWNDWSGPRDFTGEGVELRSVDRVGNEATHTASWNIDDEPPVLKLRRADGQEFEPGTIVPIRANERIEPVVEDNGSGVAQLYYLFPRVPIEHPQFFIFKTRGRLLFRLEAVDGLGNSRRAVWTLHVDLDEGTAK